ncbi:hypothetical protein ACFFQW_24825 [Umezawaea endophytica]|uniref:MazG-like nucleotide pyrophosphohydrolase family protein n=1 Tax=Umezawaea endophytica TaxID=1654476 RepID=A0A9X2VGL4_9PSEU|nr:hypothetical protein [Umezawaea endophytica]MCS7475764.1 hypothetical protein [Umezawaea endophytica]
MTEHDSELSAANSRALRVRALYERLELHLNGKVWTSHELMLGFANDVGQVGRLLLAHDGTWAVQGDPRAELEHKLAESVWWCLVLADRLGIDLGEAYQNTMGRIEHDLERAVADLGGHRT